MTAPGRRMIRGAWPIAVLLAVFLGGCGSAAVTMPSGPLALPADVGDAATWTDPPGLVGASPGPSKGSFNSLRRGFEDEDTAWYTPVVNGDNMWSIWPADRELPAGWVARGPQGPKSEVLAYIERMHAATPST